MVELESLLWKRSLSRGLPTGDFFAIIIIINIAYRWLLSLSPNTKLACHNHVFLINRCGVSDEELERKKKVYLDHLKQDPNLGFSVIIHQWENMMGMMWVLNLSSIVRISIVKRRTLINQVIVLSQWWESILRENTFQEFKCLYQDLDTGKKNDDFLDQYVHAIFR